MAAQAQTFFTSFFQKRRPFFFLAEKSSAM
jgi:hypothetical protein